MSLTGRFTALFLSVIGLVLVAFSLTVYLSARFYLSRQVGERLAAALAILAAAAEIHPGGVEWEPQERVLPLGQEAVAERLRWLVLDHEGRRIDHSRNLLDSELTPAWHPRSGNPALPGRLVDRQGRSWRISQREIAPGATPRSASNDSRPEQTSPAAADVYPSLMLTVCAPLGPMDSALRTLAWFLVGSSAAIWLGSAFLCRRLSRSALKPLATLADSARGLDATDPGWRLDETGTGDELEKLGQAFNDLLARLHVAFQSQRRFSSDASHQLRTPLTVMIGQMQVALRQERSAEEYRHALKSALARSSQLAQIVESLLFLARGDAGANLPDGEPVELGRWIDGFVESRSTIKPLEVIVHRGEADESLWVRAHPTLLEQLLDNLLDNAIKYGTADMPVVVETRRDGEHALLVVADSGPGIHESELAHIFEPFYRSEPVRRQGVPGVGLGLAVVDRIARASGGSISVQSESGKGSRFELRLPLLKPHGTASTSRSTPSPLPQPGGASLSSCTLP